MDASLDGLVGIYFIANDALLLHTCSLEDGEAYGDFINYPDSHDTIWQRDYYRRYHFDFDYFPRGRIIYNKLKNRYMLFYDACVISEAETLRNRYPKGKCIVELDEHYQCHMCNNNYIK